MLDMTRKPLSPQLGTKNHFLKKLLSFGKCRKMLWDLLAYIRLQNV